MKIEKRRYRMFSWKKALYRISSPSYEVIVREIKDQRHILETYIALHPLFKTAMEPIPLLPDMPPVARQMAEAALKTGVGPMAAVAGAMAQAGVEAAVAGKPGVINSGKIAGAWSNDKSMETPLEPDTGKNEEIIENHGKDAERGIEAIVENGGDIYLHTKTEVIVGLYPGAGKLQNTLALLIPPERMPLGICSSSSHMGHSLSLGNCDLATVIAKDGALADAAATQACNMVKHVRDIEPVLEEISSIPGIEGIILIKDERIGMIGDVPEIVRNKDPDLQGKITHDPSWDL